MGLFLEELYVVANRYACAAHLFWGYWAIIQVGVTSRVEGRREETRAH